MGDNHIPSEHCKNASQAILGVSTPFFCRYYINPSQPRQDELFLIPTGSYCTPSVASRDMKSCYLMTLLRRYVFDSM